MFDVWVMLLVGMFDCLYMCIGLQNDDVGCQLLDWIDCLWIFIYGSIDVGVWFLFIEWCVLLLMLFEFVVFSEFLFFVDWCVVILLLNGVCMWCFDGVVVVGCDDV